MSSWCHHDVIIMSSSCHHHVICNPWVSSSLIESHHLQPLHCTFLQLGGLKAFQHSRILSGWPVCMASKQPPARGLQSVKSHNVIFLYGMLPACVFHQANCGGTRMQHLFIIKPYKALRSPHHPLQIWPGNCLIRKEWKPPYDIFIMADFPDLCTGRSIEIT